MGKKSLIKSTSKKKSEPKKEGEKTTQKAAAKTAKKAPAGTAKKSTGQKTSKAKSKADPKGKAVQTSAKTKPASKKRSIKELTFLKFEALAPADRKLSVPKPTGAPPTAPPLIATEDSKEAGRLRALLVKKFSMAEIKASAKAPSPKQPVVDTPVPEVEKPRSEPTVKTAKDDAPKAPEPKPAPKPVEQSAYITVEPKAPEAQSDPVTRLAKIAVAAAVLLIFILLAVSANNSSKYYIKPIDNAIEIWKGDFSPKDKTFFMVLHGAQVPEPLMDVYSKKEVFPLVFNYYIEKSDTLLEVEGLPDFEGIRKYLHKAEDFAVTNEMKLMVKDRLNTISRMILLYKADVAISKNTEDSLESAIEMLKDAGKLTPSAMQAEEITQKIETARERIKALKAETAVQPAEK